MIVAGLEPSGMGMWVALLTPVPDVNGGQTPFPTRRAWLTEMEAKPALVFGAPVSLLFSLLWQSI